MIAAAAAAGTACPRAFPAAMGDHTEWPGRKRHAYASPRRGLLGTAALLPLGLSACVAPPPLPYPPVPALRAEVVLPPRPGVVEVWQAGHWHGRDDDWVPGRYVPRPTRAARFVPGHWDRAGPGWIWVPARWV